MLTSISSISVLKGSGERGREMLCFYRMEEAKSWFNGEGALTLQGRGETCSNKALERGGGGMDLEP